MSEWFHGRWDLRSGSIRPSMKAMDLCFGSVKLTDRRRNPTGMLNYSWKTKVILNSKAGRPMGKSLDFWSDWKILDGWCPSADGEALDFEKMIQSCWKVKAIRSWRHIRPIKMGESDAKGNYLEKTNLQCDGLLPFGFGCRRGSNWLEKTMRAGDGAATPF